MKNKKLKTITKSFGYIVSLLALLMLIDCASSTPRTVTENNWLKLTNVGFQIDSGNIVWTAGGDFKIDTIKELIVNDLTGNTPKLLFSYKGKIPKGLFLAKSSPLKGSELNFLKENNDTVLFAEIILINQNDEIQKLYTPVRFSAASKRTNVTILNIQNPNWDK